MWNPARGSSTTVLATLLLTATPAVAGDYVVVDTGQETCYDDTGNAIACPPPGAAHHGQDAQHEGHQPRYRISADGLTVEDLQTGLVWQRSPDTDEDGDIDANDKLTWVELQSYPGSLNGRSFAGFTDWRLPTIKELYSLMDFRGTDPSGCESPAECPDIVPFIDTDFFEFGYGDTEAGERLIDAQYWSSTEYVSTIFGGDAGVFGVNVADGRIKGYPRDTGPGGTMTQYVRCVRGNPDYGANELYDNLDGSITDLATGLVWQQTDSGSGLDREEALLYAEALTTAGCTDWRLPDAKELHSILDYTRSPDTSGSAAIDPLFQASPITDEGGAANWAFYWTSTTHTNWTQVPGHWGVYLAFGEALGWMFRPLPPPGEYVLQDVHGAGAQRSDPKEGDASSWPHGHGPQGDVVRIENHVRAVRGEPVRACEIRLTGSETTVLQHYPSCPAQLIQVVTGSLSELRADGDFSGSACLGSFEGVGQDPRPTPAAGDAFYYLVEGQEACEVRGYGSAAGVSPDPRDELALESPCD